MNTDSKLTLRKKFRAIRSKIPLTYREQAGEQAAKLFSKEMLFKTSEHIACYLPYNDEFNSSPLIELIWLARKNCYVPVLAEDGKSLFFVPYQYGDALHPNRFGILEPLHTATKFAPQGLDITITPLIAFDNQGHRLGTGGGYYDHTFAFLQDQQKKPVMIGLAYAAQQANTIPAEPWDILLQGVITELNFLDWQNLTADEREE